jgi:hypothetical protein
VLRVRSLGDLGEVLGVVPQERSLVAVGGSLTESVTVQGANAEHLELVRLLGAEQVVFRECQFERLVLDHCAAGGLLLVDCRIGRVEIRNAVAIRGLTVADCDLRSISVHGAGQTRLHRLSVSTRTAVSGIRAELDCRRVNTGELVVTGQLAARPDRIAVRATETTVTGDLTVRDLELGTVELRDCRVGGQLTLHRLTAVHQLLLDRLRCESRLVLDGVSCGTPLVLRDSTLRDGLDALRLAQLPELRRAATAACIEGSTIDGSLSVVTAPPSDEIALTNTTVSGQLRFPESSACYRIAGSTNVADVELSGRPMRTVRAAVAFLAGRFAEPGANEYGVVRAALARRHRPSEEDLLYFLQRQAEARATPGVRGWWDRWVLGEVLGWGVRLRAPLRSFAVGVLLTSLAVFASGMLRAEGERFWSLAAAGRCLVVAAALWLNVGTGLPNELSGGTWTAVSVVTAGMGLLLLTVLVGVAIRKLVR